MMKSMRILCALADIALLATGCASQKQEVDRATALLDNEIRPLYRDVANGTPATDIVGRTLDLSLDLRFCSEKHVLFKDTQVVVDEDTKYYFIKWTFDPAVVASLQGKKDVQCSVKGTITEVRRGETTPGMPHVIATLESVTLQP